ncbi:hypothetical protein MUK42_06734 [Musa troglodytarum]|uniref:Uncharacterized protein n=1 Tax=Musa troglodytarum TaxID=320322 RepID=A0A9E7JYU7_9LILI|nr:hypothetical protein MUK42_06734 [Musa troglodytarum]
MPHPPRFLPFCPSQTPISSPKTPPHSAQNPSSSLCPSFKSLACPPDSRHPPTFPSQAPRKEATFASSACCNPMFDLFFALPSPRRFLPVSFLAASSTFSPGKGRLLTAVAYTAFRSMVFMYQPKKTEIKNALICSLEPRVDIVVSDPGSRSHTIETLGFVVVNDEMLLLHIKYDMLVFMSSLAGAVCRSESTACRVFGERGKEKKNDRVEKY